MHAEGPIQLHPVLLGAADLGEFLRGVMVPLAILLVIVVGGWFGIRWIGKWSKSDESDRVPFSLEDLRRLRREGAISEEEFERAKEQMLSAAKRPSPARAKTPGASGRVSASSEPGLPIGSESDGSSPQVRPVPPPQLRQRRGSSDGPSDAGHS